MNDLIKTLALVFASVAIGHASKADAKPAPAHVVSIDCKSDGCDVDGFVVIMSDGNALDCDCRFNDCRKGGAVCQTR
jgi:hypothetical protein